MPPHISLKELYSMQRKKEKARHVCFDMVLELCHRRIRTIASYGGMNTFYEVPGMLVGYPLYNIHQCMAYVVESLRATGFLVQILPPPHVAVMYVSWDPSEIHPRRRQALLAAPDSHAPSAHPSRDTDYRPFKDHKKNTLRLF